MIGMGFNPAGFALRSAQNADAQRTQGAMAGGANNYEAQAKDKKEKSKARMMKATGAKLATKHLNHALQKPARKKGA
jgi:hypothetical protein